MKTDAEIRYEERKDMKKQELEKTANWRVFMPKIDLKRCDKNYRCFVVCPHDAVDIKKDGFPAIDASKCTGCLICLRECEPAAISEERE
ncbi:MAG: pyruvate synthase [Candidatus Aenigmarchaeota archaeon]|nr:pyruvate synthase [Candidatus Aenigmarchaeota archaeon]